jgi:hypothetical protein
VSRIIRAIRQMATTRATPSCCGQPMVYTGAIPQGWYCQVNPYHVR